jgi:hypothetical protein
MNFTKEEKQLIMLFMDVAVLEFLPKTVLPTKEGSTEIKILQRTEIHLSELESSFCYSIPNYFMEILFDKGPYYNEKRNKYIGIPFYIVENLWEDFKQSKKSKKKQNKKCPY